LFFVEDTYTKLGDCLGEVYYNMYCQLICKHILARARTQPIGQPLRILECGAGMGLVTRQLLPRLRAAGRRIQYWYTDLGKAFVENARKVFGTDYDFMKFSVFDITKSGLEQGLLGQYDVIISYNVIHTTDSILASVNNLKSMLDPQGRLFVIESTKNDTWATLSWGVLDGWWYFKDYALRASDPMLGHQRWEAVLQSAGFDDLVKLPRDAVEQSHVEKFLYVCGRRSSRAAPASAAAAAVVAEPAMPPGWWESWNVRKALTGAVTVDALVSHTDKVMTDEELQAMILEDVVTVWCELLGCESVPLDTPFAELGGESLLTVQMIANIRTRLGVKLELSDVFGYPTVSLLAPVVFRKVNRARAAAVAEPISNAVPLSIGK
jgi:SAM-dependent methyltransferase/acyl carrier protein